MRNLHMGKINNQSFNDENEHVVKVKKSPTKKMKVSSPKKRL